jgi:hypothetical protein
MSKEPAWYLKQSSYLSNYYFLLEYLMAPMISLIHTINFNDRLSKSFSLSLLFWILESLSQISPGLTITEIFHTLEI